MVSFSGDFNLLAQHKNHLHVLFQASAEGIFTSRIENALTINRNSFISILAPIRKVAHVSGIACFQ